jgi:hypothetical protein
MNVCKYCRFCDVEFELCRRNAPTVALMPPILPGDDAYGMGNLRPESVWPTVRVEIDWCGEYDEDIHRDVE